MKPKVITSIILILLILKLDILQAQNLTTYPYGSTIILKEPKVTKGISNIIRTTVLDTNIKKIYQYRPSDSLNWQDGGKGSQLFGWEFKGLQDEQKYWYRIILDSAGEWQDISDTVYSFQDNSPPSAQIIDLKKFQTSHTLQIHFQAKDAVCDLIGHPIKEAKLLYRAESSGYFKEYTIISYDSTDSVSSGNIVTIDTFFIKCPDSLGDGYYEFFVQCKDWACPPDDTIPDGNENKIPGDFDSLKINPAWKQIWVDTKAPDSQLEGAGDTIIIADINFSIDFSTADSSNGPRNYKSGIKKVLLYCNYKPKLNSEYVYSDSLIDSILFKSNTLQPDSFFNFEAAKGNGIYEFYSRAVDFAGNVQKDTTLMIVIVDCTVPKLNVLEVFTDSSRTDTLLERWQNIDDSPFFIWNDPQSLSDDLFYISIKRRLDDSLLFEDTITDTFLNLDLLNVHLGEGEHLFQLYAKTKSGLTSDTSYYTIMYDSTSPLGSVYLIEDQQIRAGDIKVGYRVDDLKVHGSESGINKVSLYWSYEESPKDFNFVETHNYGCFESKVESTFVFQTVTSENDRILFKLEIQDCASNISSKITNSKIVQVISPNGGEHWSYFTDNVIKWKPDKLATVSIDLIYHYGNKKNITIVKDALLEGEYRWRKEKLPQKLSELNNGSCKIELKLKFLDSSDVEYIDESDSFFVLDNMAPDSLNIIKPNGGEVYSAGEKIEIAWEKAVDNFTDWEDMDIYLYFSPSKNETIAIASTNDSVNKGDTVFQYILPDSLNSDSCKIVLEVFDKAGNFSRDESGYFTVIFEAPYIKEIKFPSKHKFVHAYEESLEIATIIFSEKVKPKNDWKSSILISDEYRNLKLSKDSYIISCKNEDFVDSLVVLTNCKFEPSKYKIYIKDYIDSDSLGGKQGSSEFWVFMESEFENKIFRKGRNDCSIEIKVPREAFQEDAIVLLDHLKNYYLYPIFREGIENYEILENSVWKVQAFDKDSSKLDTLRELNKYASISIEIGKNQVSSEEFGKLRMTKFNFDEMLWEIFSWSFTKNSSVVYDSLKKISGVYAVCKPTKSNINIIDAYPNPFNPLHSKHNFITIRFTLNKIENIDKVRIFDFFGNLVKIIPFNPVIGTNEVRWYGKNDNGNYVADGGYVCHVKRGLIAKIAVLKK